MKITSLEARSYRVPLEPPFGASWDPIPRKSFSETIVSIETDEGIRGFCGGAEVPDLSLISRFLVGVDPADTEHVWKVCASIDFHSGRNWTVEVALWDLLARIRRQPLWELLGGTQDRFRIYQSTGERVESRSARRAFARQPGGGDHGRQDQVRLNGLALRLEGGDRKREKLSERTSI